MTMLSIGWSVFRKEALDAVRDRRTLAVVLSTSLLLGPLLMTLFAQYFGRMEEHAEERAVYVEGPERAPALINFLQRRGLDVRPPPADYEAQIKNGRLTDPVIRPLPDFTERIGRGDSAAVELVFDDSHSEVEPGLRLALDGLRGFESEIGVLRLAARGVSAGALSSLEIRRINLAPPGAKAMAMLLFLPLCALIACIAGALPIAIDCTAGERERGSLEPLLMTPADTLAIASGKWAAVTSFSWAAVALTIAAFAVVTRLIRQESIASLLQFGVAEALAFLAVLLPFSMLISAALMLIAISGRTYKEAQAHSTYLVTLLSLLPTLVMLLSVKDAPWQRFVPALAQQMVMARVTRGEAIGALDLAIPGAISIGGAVLALALVARLLRDERIVFGRSEG